MFSLLNTNPCRPLTANPSALAGHIERTLVLQEDLLAAGSRGIHASLRPRFDAHVRAVNSSLCAAWEAAQEMIEHGTNPKCFEVSDAMPRSAHGPRGAS